ncbi:Multifunctional pyrimidine synthesis protein CAD [Blyttiomyces sp. JEL0837]|nr:Multifunctional pyrimidine synthesis protein CAD [Blyttiomyces sp. JEL0837]
MYRSTSIIARGLAVKASTTGIVVRAAATALPNVIAKSASISATPRRALASISNDVFIKPNQTGAPPAPPSAPEPPSLPATLRLATGHVFKGTSFGAPIQDAKFSGEVVFTTSLVGYPESMTDPSYRGQILVFTQPLIGNYGVPSEHAKDKFGLLEHFEADNGIQVRGIVVNDYAAKYSHWAAVESLGQWCARYGVPAITGVDTRAIVSLLRERGSTLGEIAVGDNVPTGPLAAEDPNARNLCAEVSVKEKRVYNPAGDVSIALIDCGVKQNIIRCLAKRGAKVTVVPWDHDLTKDAEKYDGVFLSNGPGDPRVLTKTAGNLRAFMNNMDPVPVPIFGICMGNLVMGMAAGYNVYKLPYGNRGHNQPAIDLTSNRCVITSQNHGYALDDSARGMATVEGGWLTYFRNANDGSNEGIRHAALPYSSVQFHPEAMGGPEDTDYLFDNFVHEVRAFKRERKREGYSAFSHAQEFVSDHLTSRVHA